MMAKPNDPNVIAESKADAARMALVVEQDPAKWKWVDDSDLRPPQSFADKYKEGKAKPVETQR